MISYGVPRLANRQISSNVARRIYGQLNTVAFHDPICFRGSGYGAKQWEPLRWARTLKFEWRLMDRQEAIEAGESALSQTRYSVERRQKL